MGMWEVIQYAGTPLTLVAFIAAAVAFGYRRFATSRIAAIEAAPIDDRADLVARLFDTYQMKDDNLTRDQKFELMVSVLEHRAERFRVVAITSVVIALLLCVVLIIALLNGPKSQIPEATSGATSLPGTKTKITTLPIQISSTSEVPDAKSQEIDDISRILQTLTIRTVSRKATIDSLSRYVASPSADAWQEVKFYQREKLDPQNELLTLLSERLLHTLNLTNEPLHARLVALLDTKAKLSRSLKAVGDPPHSDAQLAQLGGIAEGIEAAKIDMVKVGNDLRAYVNDQNALKSD